MTSYLTEYSKHWLRLQIGLLNAVGLKAEQEALAH